MIKPLSWFLKPMDNDMFAMTNQIKCPVCGDEYVHIGQPTFKATDEYDAWEGRGNCASVPMECEAGQHEWEVKFGFHKGYTFAFIEHSLHKKGNSDED